MPVQIVADRNGDTRHHFDASDAASVAEAKARFDELVVRRKMIAYDLGQNGEGASLLRRFDPTVGSTGFFPQRRGG